MALIKLSSTNPHLSYILVKNPATQAAANAPFSRNLRKGVVYGWYDSSAQGFNLWFKDAEHECSFAEGRDADFEYLDQTRYSSPLLPAAMITALLNDSWRKHQEYDEPGFDNYLIINTFYIHRMESFKRAFRSLNGRFDIELTHVRGKVYRVKVSTKETIQALLCVVSLISLQQFQGSTSLMSDLSEKYLKMLNIIQAPFYLRHVFARILMQDFNTFRKNKALIDGPNMDLKFGDTRMQRFNYIKGHLKGGNFLIDIGCGELYQAIKLARNYDFVYACDKDPEILEANQGRIKKRKIENVIPLGGFEESFEDMTFEGDSVVHVLATEVLEHMSQDEARALLEKLKEAQVDCIVATVPDREFNKYYGMAEDEIRHTDHKWEPTRNEFASFIASVFPSDQFDVLVEHAGDTITEDDGKTVSTSIGVVITRKEAS